MATKKISQVGSSGATKSTAFASTSSIATIPRRRANFQPVQNVLLVWLDSNIDVNTIDCQNTVNQLRRAMNDINLFADETECIRFIEQIKENKICMITSGSLGQHVVPKVHNIFQVEAIFIFCGDKKLHEKWVKEWSKIRGVFTDIDQICETLKETSKKCEQDATSISYVRTGDGTMSKSLNLLDPTFMYTEMMKKIFFTIQFNQNDIKQFIDYCRVHFEGNTSELEIINHLEKNYGNHTPIWWYTMESFLFPMLNTALRVMNGEMMIKMSFFINDLHRQIERLHVAQFSSYSAGATFTVFRGQGLSKTNFEQLKKTKGGLMSFNNFLSTSKKRNTSMTYAKDALVNPDSVGILFVMTIDPARSTTPFASVNKVGYFKDGEDEVLFSMHSIFRIHDIQQMNEHSRLFQVNLTLTKNSDEDLRELSARMEEDTSPEETGWFRVGCVLLKMGQPKTAEEVFEGPLLKPGEESNKGTIYRFLALAKDDQGQYKEALKLYDKSITIYKKTLPPNHPHLTNSYSNIGLVYYNMGDYPRALSSLEKALAIKQESLLPNHPNLAKSYNNIGLVCYSMGNYPKALSSYEKALAIQKQSLPSTHPSLAGSYNNIGGVHDSMGQYSKALSYYKEALAIQQQSLPPNHPDLAKCHSNIGLVYDKMGDYRKALSSHEKALAMKQESLPSTHPSLARSYGNIGAVFEHLGDYGKARSNYERAIAIVQHSLPSTHPTVKLLQSDCDRVKGKM